MYSPDTLERLNEAEVAKHLARVEAETNRPTCDYCDEPADHALPLYNPADGVRGVEGAYAMIEVCDEHYEDGTYLEENFHCADCGELFILNHSWDVVAVIDSEAGEIYCQKCYAENHLEGQPLYEVLENLERRVDTGGWKRLNGVPGKELLWEGEYSGYSDFPGHTSLESVAQELREAAEEAGAEEGDTVYPVVSQGYQFSVVLAVYR